MACQNQSSGAMVFFVPREPCSGVLHFEQLPSASVSPLLCSGEVAATFLPLHGSLKVTLQGCPGLLTPCLGEFSPSPLLLAGSCWCCQRGQVDPRYLGEDRGVGIGKDTSGQFLVPHGSATFPSATLGPTPALCRSSQYPLEGPAAPAFIGYWGPSGTRDAQASLRNLKVHLISNPCHGV